MTEPTRGLRQLDQEAFDAASAIGGVRGLIEAVAPGLVFLVLFVATRNLTLAAAVAVAVGLIACVARLIGRTPVTQAVGGLFGLAVSAIWAWRSGQAENFFAWGLWVNAGFTAVTLASILIRRPLVGFLVGTLFPSAADGLATPAGRRATTLATWLWVAAFAARLAVQIPLYLSAQVGWLGTARLIMGAPMWLLVLWLTWVLVSPYLRSRAAPADLADQQDRPTS